MASNWLAGLWIIAMWILTWKFLSYPPLLKWACHMSFVHPSIHLYIHSFQTRTYFHCIQSGWPLWHDIFLTSQKLTRCAFWYHVWWMRHVFLLDHSIIHHWLLYIGYILWPLCGIQTSVTCIDIIHTTCSSLIALVLWDWGIICKSCPFYHPLTCCQIR